jgi:hypothetical protein
VYKARDVLNDTIVAVKKVSYVVLYFESVYYLVSMHVCIRGGLLQPLHLDPQWSIVLNPYDR